MDGVTWIRRDGEDRKGNKGKIRVIMFSEPEAKTTFRRNCPSLSDISRKQEESGLRKRLLHFFIGRPLVALCYTVPLELWQEEISQSSTQ